VAPPGDAIVFVGLSVVAIALTACSSVPTPSTDVLDYDTSSSALTTTNQTYRELSIWGEPISGAEDADGGAPSGYTCGQNSYGTCPTKTVNCVGNLVLSITLVYGGDGSGNACIDSSGTKVAGTVVLTRNGIRDWTVAFTNLLRGANASPDAGANANGLALNGSVGFKKQLGQSAWGISLAGLTASGTTSGGSTIPSCTRSCVSRTAFTTTPTFAFTTPDGGALTLDATLTGQRKIVVGGTVLMAGAVTGQIDWWWKNLAGNEQSHTKVLDAGALNQTVTLSDVTYNLPFACTGPTSGSVATTSFLGCGTTTIAFAPSTAQGTCATATASYSNAANAVVCGFSDDLVSQSVTEACLPIQ
jgi:hypothetical protein